MGRFLLVCAAATIAASAWAQTTDELFDDSTIQEFRFDIRASDWALLKQNYLLNTYYPIDFHYKYKGRDILVSNVGIRSRGRGSRSPIKPNLRVDFNRYEDGQKFLGLSSLVLKANDQDASFLKEKTVFKLWSRTGLPVSREAYARLYVNNEYIGLYLATEEIRDEFVQRTIGEGSGDLYEWKPIDDFHFEWRPTCSTKEQLACSTDSNRWQPVPFNPEENKKTFDLAPTINLFKTVTEVSDTDFERTVSTMLDLKLWVFHNAIENWAADFDSILGDVFGMNNFFLYRYDKTNFHQFLPWDKDASFDWSARPVLYHTDQNVLMRRTLAIPARRAQYLESANKVAVLAGGPGGWFEWVHNLNYNQIRQSALDDVNKQYAKDGTLQPSSNAIFEAEVVKDHQFILERTPNYLADLADKGAPVSATLKIAAGGALNAATNVPGAIAPGSDVSLYGEGFTNQVVVATSDPLPTKLAGVSVYVNGFLAPLLFVSPGQINLQVPWELGLGNGTAPFTVSVDGPTAKGTSAGSPVNATFSNSINATVKSQGPGVYAVYQGVSGRLVQNDPAGAADILVVYATGLGPVNLPVTTGKLAASELNTTKATPQVTIGGKNADILFSGLTPGTAGVYQINIRVPQGVTAGSAPLVITAQGESSPAVTIATK